MKAILYTAYSFKKPKDLETSDMYYKMHYALLSIPFNSGDGESAETAFIVSSVQDEYLILDDLSGSFSGQALVSENGSSYDVMSLTIGGEDMKLYFNIDQPFGIGLAGMFDNSKSKKKKEKRRRKNNLSDSSYSKACL